MPTLVQTLYSVSGSPSNSLVFTGVQVGDTLIVDGESFFQPAGATCTDSTGNVYAGPFISNKSFGFLRVFITIAQTAGTVTATVTLNGVASLALGLNFRDMPPFDQYAPSLSSQYTPTDPSYPFGVGTSPFTLADTTIISFVYDSTGSTPGPFVASDSGDTLIYEPLFANSYVFQRNAVGPGNSQSLFKCKISGATLQLPALSLTFSKPLTRPLGVTEQYAFRGGYGFAAEATPAPNEYKAPLPASLPYLPDLGSLVVVGVSYTGCSIAVTDLAVEDDYGNIYTKDILTVGNGTGIALYHTLVTNLPPVGETFRARLITTVAGCTGAVYQTTGIAIAEKQIASLLNIAAAGFNHDINSAPNITLVSDTLTSVPASTWLVGLAIYPGGVNQTNIAWTPLDGYALQQQENFVQFPFAFVNDGKVGCGAVLSKFVNSPGDYDVQAIATQTGSYNEAGAIALLAATVTLPTPPPPGPLTIACPVSGTGTVGVPYLGMIMVSGGTPPYHYELI